MLDQFLAAIFIHYGPRCLDESQGCPVCEAWAVYDVAKKLADTIEQEARDAGR